MTSGGRLLRLATASAAAVKKIASERLPLAVTLSTGNTSSGRYNAAMPLDGIQ